MLSGSCFCLGLSYVVDCLLLCMLRLLSVVFVVCCVLSSVIAVGWFFLLCAPSAPHRCVEVFGSCGVLRLV